MGDTITAEEVRDVCRDAIEWADDTYHDDVVQAVRDFEQALGRGVLSDRTLAPAFHEWVLFDAMIGGHTGAVCAYAAEGPEGSDRDIAREVADTVVFSQFEVRIARDGAMGMRDVVCDTHWDVGDLGVPDECQWDFGLVACHLARVDGHDVFLSLVPMHDMGGNPLRPDPDANDFLTMCSKVLGQNGRYAKSTHVIDA